MTNPNNDWPFDQPLGKDQDRDPKGELEIVLSGQFHTLAMLFVFLGDDDEEKKKKKNWL